jgi:hypothetical protein
VELRPLSQDRIPSALEKAVRYRQESEPGVAESICLDVLALEPDHQEAIAILLMARADQFAARPEALSAARELLPRVHDEARREYYAGVVCERHAKTLLQGHRTRARSAARGELRRAMAHFERAAALGPREDDDALLRWNACARLLGRETHLDVGSPGEPEPMIE